MVQTGGVIGHGTADLQTIPEEHRPELGHQLLAGIGPAAIAALTHAAGEITAKPGAMACGVDRLMGPGGIQGPG